MDASLLAANGLVLFPRSPVARDGVIVRPRRIGGGSAAARRGTRRCGTRLRGRRAPRRGPGVLHLCPTSHANAVRLREVLPETAPSPLASRDATFGTGDRLGLAGPGHLAVFRRYAASPVLAQQSLRELTLTSRTYEDVLDASTWAVFREGWREPWGADGDHLKTEEWVRKALAIGFTMITADVSDYIRGEWAARGDAEVLARWGQIDAGPRAGLEQRYLGRRSRWTRARRCASPRRAGTNLARLRRGGRARGRLYEACVAERARVVSTSSCPSTRPSPRPRRRRTC